MATAFKIDPTPTDTAVAAVARATAADPRAAQTFEKAERPDPVNVTDDEVIAWLADRNCVGPFTADFLDDIRKRIGGHRFLDMLNELHRDHPERIPELVDAYRNAPGLEEMGDAVERLFAKAQAPHERASEIPEVNKIKALPRFPVGMSAVMAEAVQAYTSLFGISETAGTDETQAWFAQAHAIAGIEPQNTADLAAKLIVAAHEWSPAGTASALAFDVDGCEFPTSASQKLAGSIIEDALRLASRDEPSEAPAVVTARLSETVRADENPLAEMIRISFASEMERTSFPDQARRWHALFKEDSELPADDMSNEEIDAFADRLAEGTRYLCEAKGQSLADISLKLKAGLAYLRGLADGQDGARISARAAYHDGPENLIFSAMVDAERLAASEQRADEHDAELIQTYGRFRRAFATTADTMDAEKARWETIDSADEALRARSAATPLGVALKLKSLFVDFVGETWSDDAVPDSSSEKFREGLAKAEGRTKAMWGCIEDLVNMAGSAALDRARGQI